MLSTNMKGGTWRRRDLRRKQHGGVSLSACKAGVGRFGCGSAVLGLRRAARRRTAPGPPALRHPPTEAVMMMLLIYELNN